ncbi:MAG: hypothetical protein FWD97_01765 [Defluviitaleaceae bacterium]|nr:hypothetical protein [Defluviitaleaceae bacterium]
MLKTKERLGLVLSLTKYGLDLGLVKEFSSERLLKLCQTLEEEQAPKSWYLGQISIQKELLQHERFLLYLDKVNNIEHPDPNLLGEFVKVIHDHGESACDYSIDRFAKSVVAVTETRMTADVFYNFLSCFSGSHPSEEHIHIIIENLSHYGSSLSKPVAEFPDKEKTLFAEKALTLRSLMPESKDINKTFEMLAEQDALLDIIRFFYENEVGADLTIDNYKSFSKSPAETLKKLEEIKTLLDVHIGSLGINMFVKCWLRNNCPKYDLDMFMRRIKEYTADAQIQVGHSLQDGDDGVIYKDENTRQSETGCQVKTTSGEDDNETTLVRNELKAILHGRSSYINFIYGDRISTIPLQGLPHYKEDILIYAITNKKTAFIRLVEENPELFSLLGQDSILFEQEFYTKYININALNTNNLRDCVWMVNPTYRRMIPKLQFDNLEDNKTYTFEEIKILYGLPEQYYRLYAGLDISRIDEKLKVFRQITKRKLLAKVSNDDHVTRLAKRLSQKPLSEWHKDNFAHISGIKAQDAVHLLIHWDEVKGLIAQMKVKADALLVIRNANNACTYQSLDDMKSDLISVDVEWGKLAKNMKLSNDFLIRNKDCIVDFLNQNGADIAHTYFSGLKTEGQKESFKRIVKSVLMGEFASLKYHGDDLRKELEYPVVETQKLVWMDNSALSGRDSVIAKNANKKLAKGSGDSYPVVIGAGDIEIRECDDFYGTMLLGTMPQRTCLSYIDGNAKDCLLSGFDSNKKILQAHKDGEVVGRALFRLTKGRFDAPPTKIETSLSFVDLDKDKETSVGNSSGDVGTFSRDGGGRDGDGIATDESRAMRRTQERLIIFLERPYTAGVCDNTAEAIKAMYVELLSKKAEDMGAMLVLSNSYEGISKDFVRTSFHVYISKSKAGAQYLDSLNGSAYISDEGGYRSNVFYIHRNSLE